MLSEDTLRQIAELFNGDVEGLYSYKSGGRLVRFFNEKFGYSDVYGQGFPSRWQYTYNKLVELIETRKFEVFLNIILNNRYMMNDLKVSESQTVVQGKNIVDKLNEYLEYDGFIIQKNVDKYVVVKIDDDIKFIGEGGFARVYKQLSSGVIIKKLKEDFVFDETIKSRFKREFEITKSLGNLENVLNVYDYNEKECSYSMEEGELTLFEYINNNSLSIDNQIICIRQILVAMGEIHSREIIHRDISPNNILIVRGILKISDFGLGKDLNIFNSHQTIYTNAVGQFNYCAPEQFMLLKDGDKRSDVFSLGKLINFILTKNPNINNHFLRVVTEKATSQNPSFRYSDAIQMLKYAEKAISLYQQGINKSNIQKKINGNVFDIEVEQYLYQMNGSDFCQEIIRSVSFRNCIYSFMKISEENSVYAIQLIEDNYKDVCSSWGDYDNFAIIANYVINDKFPYVVKEVAANILYYVAHSVNRFSAQKLIEKTLSNGVEPMLEELLV